MLATWALDPQLSTDQETVRELIASATAYEGLPPTSHVTRASAPSTIPGSAAEIDLQDCTTGNATFQTFSLAIGKDRTIQPQGNDAKLLTVVLVETAGQWKVSYAADAAGVGCVP